MWILPKQIHKWTKHQHLQLISAHTAKSSTGVAVGPSVGLCVGNKVVGELVAGGGEGGEGGGGDAYRPTACMIKHHQP